MPASARAAEPLQGRLRLVLEEGLPWQGKWRPRYHRGHKYAEPDLHIDLLCRDGRVLPGGRAWTPAMPGVDHAVQVAESEADGARLKLKLRITFDHQLPDLLGGKGEYVVDIRRSRRTFFGSYSGKTEGADDRKAQALWRRYGGRGTAQFDGRVATGQARSILRIARKNGSPLAKPIAARGRLEPLPDLFRFMTQPPAARPQLLTNRTTLRTVRRRLQGADGRALLNTLRRLLADGATGNATAAQKRRCDGFAAAGHAALFAFADDAGAAKQSERLAIAAAAAIDSNRNVDIPRELAGLALAWDLAGDTWSAPAQRQVVKTLSCQARRLAAVRLENETLRDSPFAADGAIGRPDGPWDYRLGRARAAAGLAALSLRGVKTRGVLCQGDIAMVVRAATRGVERLLRHGFGEHGAPSGHAYADETLEILLPFLQAYRNAGGKDLTDDTNAAEIAWWALMSEGQCFDHAEPFADGYWLPLGVALLDDPRRAAARWYWQRVQYRPANPWHAVFALLNLPDDVAPIAPDKLGPNALEDQRIGAYLLRDGWHKADTPAAIKDCLTRIRLGSAPWPAAAQRGHLSLRGLGREWIHNLSFAHGVAAWPEADDLNVVQVQRSPITGRKAAVPMFGGRRGRVRVQRSGTGSVSVHGGAFRDIKHDGGRNKDLEESHAWRTIGVDYSGRSGAAAVLVMVEGNVGLADRTQVWEIDIGNVRKEEVKVDGDRFTIRPQDTRASLRGQFLYPATAFLEYVPPTKQRGARLRAHREKPRQDNKQMLTHSIDGTGGMGLDDIDAELGSELGMGKASTTFKKRKRLAQRVFHRVFLETSSAKMGGGDAAPKAEGSWVMVMTLQEGTPPALEILGGKDTTTSALVKVGSQVIGYREHMIDFDDVDR